MIIHSTSIVFCLVSHRDTLKLVYCNLHKPKKKKAFDEKNVYTECVTNDASKLKSNGGGL